MKHTSDPPRSPAAISRLTEARARLAPIPTMIAQDESPFDVLTSLAEAHALLEDAQRALAKERCVALERRFQKEPKRFGERERRELIALATIVMTVGSRRRITCMPQTIQCAVLLTFVILFRDRLNMMLYWVRHGGSAMHFAYPQAITENAEDLREYEQRVRGTAAAPRVQMLRLLKSGEATNVPQVATLVGYSPRHIQRWWQTYRTAGLVALIRVYHPAEEEE